MAVYQIYKILFNRSRQGNLLSKMDGRSAYDKAQELLEEMLGGVLPLTKEKRDKTLVPVYSIRAACGAFNHGDTTELEGWMNVKKLGINPKKDYYLVHAEGNSMEPKIHDGDLCVFAYTNAEEEGEIMLVESNKDDCQHVIKVYHSEKRQVDAFTIINKVKLHSLNPDYDDIELTEEHNPKITGILVDVIKKER